MFICFLSYVRSVQLVDLVDLVMLYLLQLKMLRLELMSLQNFFILWQWNRLLLFSMFLNVLALVFMYLSLSIKISDQVIYAHVKLY